MSNKKSYKELTNSDKEYVALIYEEENMGHEEKTRLLAEKYGVVERTIRNWWTKLGVTKNNSQLPIQLQKARENTLDGDEEVLLITALQNKTLLHKEMWENMLTYKSFIEEVLGKKARIVVIPSRYRNPITLETIKKYKKQEWWAPEVSDYLYYYRLKFGNLTVAADVRVRPTAMNPLSGFEPLAGDGHLILGHPRHQFKTLARFKGDTLKTMGTTGFLNRSSYTVSKAGAKAGEHHSYGFVVCEKDTEDKCFVPRKVKVNFDGSFTDVVWNVSDSEVTRIDSSDGFVWGDIHNQVLDPKKKEASDALMSMLNPEKVIFHDVLDGASFNPHEKKDLFIRRRKILEGNYNIEEEVDSSLDFLEHYAKKPGLDVFVIQSNHDEFLDRHIKETDWRKDLHNSGGYLKYASIQQSEDLREHGNIFGFLINQRYGDDVTYVKYTDPLRINGYLNFHGEFGSNGSRGSATVFRKLNTKVVHAHTHSPYMLDNVMCVGTSTMLWQYYNSKGPSSWAFSDAIYHSDGKNQLIVYNDNYEFSNLMAE